MNKEYTWEKEFNEKGEVVKVTLVKTSKSSKEAEPVKEAK